MSAQALLEQVASACRIIREDKQKAISYNLKTSMNTSTYRGVLVEFRTLSAPTAIPLSLYIFLISFLIKSNFAWS